MIIIIVIIIIVIIRIYRLLTALARVVWKVYIEALDLSIGFLLFKYHIHSTYSLHCLSLLLSFFISLQLLFAIIIDIIMIIIFYSYPLLLPFSSSFPFLFLPFPFSIFHFQCSLPSFPYFKASTTTTRVESLSLK